MVERDPGFIALVFELFTSARRHEEIAAEVSELHRRIREHVADQLERKRAEGVVVLAGDPSAVATVLLALGDGLALRMLAEPDSDFSATIQAGVACARTLLGRPV
jgi:hypothetical protein